MTKVSIVLPTYNGSRYIKDSINSIIGQTFLDWELIIINDCSTDETLAICEEFAQKDNRIKVFSNQENLKLPASLNVGFSKATGEYLTWTSDDNLYKPNAIEVMSKYLDNNSNVDFVSADMDWIDEELNVIGKASDKCKRNSPITLTYYCNIGACFLYRKEIANAVGSYDETCFLAEDIDYWYRIALSGNIHYINENLYQYRTSPYNLSNTRTNACREAECRVRAKYANDIINKYAKNIFEKLACWYQISQKDKNFVTSYWYIIYHFLYVKPIKFILNWGLHFHSDKKRLRAKILMNLTTV